MQLWKKVGKEELTECVCGDPVIYARSCKDFKIASKEECMERNITLALGIDIVSEQTRHNTTRPGFII